MTLFKNCSPCEEPSCVTDVDLDASGKTLLITYSDGDTEELDLSALLDWMVDDPRFTDAVEKLLKDPNTFLENMKRLLNSPDVSQIIDGNTIKVDRFGRLYVPDATTEQKGVVRLATQEDIDGGNETKAVTPKLLKDAIDNIPTPEAPEVDPDSILGRLKNCDEDPISAGELIATCQNLWDAIANIDPSEFVAKIPGNRIQVRDGKLAVIDEAPPDLAKQYVDYNNGNDDNPGTEDEPLKTLARAMQRIAEGPGVGTYQIYLHAGQEHPVNQYLRIVNNATLQIVAYGDEKYGTTLPDENSPDYYPGTSSDYARPSLKFDVFTTDEGGQNFVAIPVISASRIEIIGVDLNVTGPDSTLPGWFNLPLVAVNSLDILGANITLSNDHQLTRASSARIRNVNVYFSDTARLLDATFGPTLTMPSENYEAGEIKDVSTTRPAYTIASWQNRANITSDNIGLNFVNVDGKYIPTNGGTNWTLED